MSIKEKIKDLLFTIKENVGNTILIAGSIILTMWAILEMLK